MTTMTIKLPGKAKGQISALVKELGGEIISISTNKAAKKTKLLDEIRAGLKEVKEIEAGRSKFHTMSDIFDGE